VPRIGDEIGATVILPTPKPVAPLDPEQLNPGLAPGIDESPRVQMPDHLDPAISK
jgi:hypothetical protein